MPCIIISRVSQYSVLEPIRFFILINDVFAYVIAYADDIIYSNINKNLE